MKKLFSISCSVLISIITFAQNKLEVGLGIGNVLKSAISPFVLETSKNSIWFDVNLRHTKSDKFASQLEYTFYNQYDLSSTTLFNDVVHQPKVKLFFQLSNNQHWIWHEIGPSLAINFTNSTRTVTDKDIFGGQYSKTYHNKLTTAGIGLTYHININLNRFTFVFETEIGKILDNSIYKKMLVLNGFGLPLSDNGFYLNADIELYYSLTKNKIIKQGKKVQKSEFEFK